MPDPKSVRIQRRITLGLTVGPLVAFVVAVWSLWGWGISAVDLALLGGTYLFSALGVTVGFHRLLTHKSFDAAPAVRAIFAVAGSAAVQGSVISWVATHRRHHAYSDAQGDPHSPHLDPSGGVGGVFRGLWHAHVGWLFDSEGTSAERWAPDLRKERAILAIDRLFPLIAVATFVAPALLGFVLSGSARGAATGLIWGGLVRVFLLHHVTWSINSICHFYGRRPYRSRDESTNNWPLALLSLGESWHNNHHAFPSAARHGLGRMQVDLSAVLIWTLERIGLARRVRRVTPQEKAAKLRRSGRTGGVQANPSGVG